MNFYERMRKKEIHVPSRFDISYGQLCDIKENAPGLFDIMYVCFQFGYIQGVRAERKRKAGAAICEQ